MHYLLNNYHYCPNCNSFHVTNIRMSGKFGLSLIRYNYYFVKTIEGGGNQEGAKVYYEPSSDGFDEIEIPSGNFNDVIEHLRYCHSCGKSDSFDVDEKMIPILKNLNSKGIVTTFSCSGHFDNYTEGVNGTYLLIDIDNSTYDIDKLKSSLKFLEEESERLGLYFIKETNSKDEYRDYDSLKIAFKAGADLMEVDPMYLKSVNLLYEWSLKL